MILDITSAIVLILTNIITMVLVAVVLTRVWQVEHPELVGPLSKILSKKKRGKVTVKTEADEVNMEERKKNKAVWG